MKHLGVVLCTILLSSVCGSSSLSEYSASILVNFLEVQGEDHFDLVQFADLIRKWLDSCHPEENGRYTVPSNPENDFITPIHQNIFFRNFQLCETVRMLPINLKVHHVNILCKACDESTPRFMNSFKTVYSLTAYEQNNILKKIIKHCWDQEFVLYYLKDLFGNCTIDDVLWRISIWSPETLVAFFYLGFGTSPPNVEMKSKIIMPLIRHHLSEADTYSKLRSIFERACKCWSDPKFGRSLPIFQKDLPQSPESILLFSRYGFPLICDNKKEYFNGLQKASDAFLFFKLADHTSVLSKHPRDISILICLKIAFHAAPILRTLKINYNYDSVIFQIHDLDTIEELITKACRQFNMDPTRGFSLHNGDRILPILGIVKDIEDGWRLSLIRVAV